MRYAPMYPIHTTFEKFAYYTFSLDLDPDTEDSDEMGTEIEDFVRRAQKRYFERYSVQPLISKFARRVCPTKLARDVLAIIEDTQECKGKVRLNLFIANEYLSENQYFYDERISYSLHWFENEVDQSINHSPIGFYTTHLLFTNEKTMTSRVVFDTRVPHNELIDSKEFMLGEVFPNNELYLEHVEKVYQVMTGQPLGIDLEPFVEKVKTHLTSVYDTLLANPDNDERTILYMDTAFFVEPVDETMVSIRLCVNLIEDVEVTSTPLLHTWNNQYKQERVRTKNLITSIETKPLLVPHSEAIANG